MNNRYKINLILEDREDNARSTVHYETNDASRIVEDLRAKADLIEKTGLVVRDFPIEFYE